MENCIAKQREEKSTHPHHQRKLNRQPVFHDAQKSLNSKCKEIRNSSKIPLKLEIFPKKGEKMLNN